MVLWTPHSEGLAMHFYNRVVNLAPTVLQKQLGVNLFFFLLKQHKKKPNRELPTLAFLKAEFLFPTQGRINQRVQGEALVILSPVSHHDEA